MALSAGRTLVYLIGVMLVVAAAFIFFTETNLGRWVPTALLVAGLLLIIGLAVMGFATEAPSERGGPRHGHHDDDTHGGGDVTVVKH